jgi:hypothetical protein
MPNLNGFAIFDEDARYEIDLPNGWKQDADEKHTDASGSSTKK